MTYIEFKNDNMGKGIDYDGSYGNQCWDLGQKYLVKCLGLPEYILGGVGYVGNMLVQPKLGLLLQYFDEVPLNAMQPGDVCIWAITNSAYPKSHIAIFDSWDGVKCWYFSQNPNLPALLALNSYGMRAFRVKPAYHVEPKIVDVNDKVKITVAELNIRSGYGTSYPIIGLLTKDKIVEINAKYNNWGKLKDGRGWICLDYTEVYVEPVIEVPKEEIPVIEEPKPVEETPIEEEPTKDTETPQNQTDVPDNTDIPDNTENNEIKGKESEKTSILMKIINLLIKLFKMIFKKT